ncbi:MAG: hypothetical protein IJU19_00820 [Bacteroidales bacterium]|nr:hypothetical protein [Bacteroidales bacterium]
MERKLTKKQIARNARNNAIRSRYRYFMSVGSSAIAVYEELANEFGVSKYTVFNVIKEYPNSRKNKRKHTPHKKPKAIN